MTTKEKSATKTAYVVLGQLRHPDIIDVTRFDGPTWAAVATIEAHAPDAAIRAHVESLPAEAHSDGSVGVFVAVPARSWKPITVTSETKVVVKIGAAGE